MYCFRIVIFFEVVDKSLINLTVVLLYIGR